MPRFPVGFRAEDEALFRAIFERVFQLGFEQGLHPRHLGRGEVPVGRAPLAADAVGPRVEGAPREVAASDGVAEDGPRRRDQPLDRQRRQLLSPGRAGLGDGAVEPARDDHRREVGHRSHAAARQLAEDLPHAEVRLPLAVAAVQLLDLGGELGPGQGGGRGGAGFARGAIADGAGVMVRSPGWAPARGTVAHRHVGTLHRNMIGWIRWAKLMGNPRIDDARVGGVRPSGLAAAGRAATLHPTTAAARARTGAAARVGMLALAPRPMHV